MSDQAKIGVFLCQCGQRIAGPVDLEALKKRIAGNELVDYVAVSAYPCMGPGLNELKNTVKEMGLDRLVVAGCESRIMLKKFERELDELGIREGQVDIVNLRGHVAQVHRLEPAEMAAKGAKLIEAAVAGLAALKPTPREKVKWEGPVMILGGGIATYAAAHELASRELECIIALQTDEYEDELRMLHEHYPGERRHYARLEKIMKEVDSSPYVRRITVGELTGVAGRTGDYQVSFSTLDGNPPLVHQASAIIACLDGQMLNQGSDFGHDGKNVICHTEAEEMMWIHGVPQGRIVFWVNDYESGTPEFAYLSARTAWSMARYMAEQSSSTEITIVYNSQMSVPLSAGERKLSRELGIKWVAFDGAFRPTVQQGFLTYCSPDDHLEYELPWDKLILSPRRSVGVEVTKVARILGLEPKEGRFLEHKSYVDKVRPEMSGRGEAFLAGSARYPCDLQEALRQGRRAAVRVAELIEKAKEGRLYAPRMVCSVDQSLCIGCGLCKEICACGGIEPVEGPGGGIPRRVDPMVCTGGGTCAAACPYHALTLQNNTTDQRLARVAALARALEEGEVMAFGCAWGGLAAADNAGTMALKYDPRLHLLSVGCIGQLDPAVMARAFVEGANGLLLIGCPPEECHHSYGLDHTWSRVVLIKKLLDLTGIDRRRIALAHADLNRPEEYVVTVESFIELINELGPIDRSGDMNSRLAGLFAAVNNARVRWVLGASLRRPWEEVYPGDQRNALAFDSDLTSIVKEEYIKARLLNLLSSEERYFSFNEVTEALGEDKTLMVNGLREMVSEGIISRVHQDGVAHYLMRA